MVLLRDFKGRPWSEVDTVWCLAVRLSWCIGRASPVKYNLGYSIRQTFFFSVDNHPKNSQRLWKSMKRGKYSTAGSRCYTNISHWCPEFFPFAIPPTPLKLNTTGFSLKSTILSIAFCFFPFFLLLSGWQTLSVHGWSFKASVSSEFQGK